MNWALDLVAHHPKLSQGIAWATTGISGVTEYVHRSMGIAPESWSEIGIIVGVMASIFVMYANYRRLRFEADRLKFDAEQLRFESEQNQLDAEIKQLQIERMKIDNSNLELDIEDRRKKGEPLRRSTDKLDEE